MTVAELKDRMTVAELQDWLAVFALEKEAQLQEDLRQTTTVELARAQQF